MSIQEGKEGEEKGGYSTGGYYTDVRFSNLHLAFSTMAVYLIDGSNFDEVAEPALAAHGIYVILFMIITLFSVFFGSAFLITLFMDNYENGTG